jgi:hypothetical protein
VHQFIMAAILAFWHTLEPVTPTNLLAFFDLPSVTTAFLDLAGAGVGSDGTGS